MAREIGADPAFVIAATHGKRAIDNLARFKPHLHPDELSAAVEEFERSILFYADAHANANAAGGSTPSLLSDAGSGPGSSAGSSCVSSLVQSAAASTEQLIVVSGPQAELADELAIALTAATAVEKGCFTSREGAGEWECELEAAGFDRAVRVLPGVKALLASIPEGRYAVATSGAKTYGAPPLAIRPGWSSNTDISSSTWMSLASGHRPAQSHDHGGRPTPPGGKARAGPVPPCGRVPRLQRRALRRIRRLAERHQGRRRGGRHSRCGVHEPLAKAS